MALTIPNRKLIAIITSLSTNLIDVGNNSCARMFFAFMSSSHVNPVHCKSKIDRLDVHLRYL